MYHYNQPSLIKNLAVTDSGLYEINFKDLSRYIGQMNDNIVEGRGTLYIQDVAKLEGKFFNNRILEGMFFFDSVLVYEGTFDDQEIFTKGVIELTQTRDRISLICAGSQILSIKLLNENTEFDFNPRNTKPFIHQMGSGLYVSINKDRSEIAFKQLYNDNLIHGEFISVNLKKKCFFHQNYEFNHLSKLQKELYFQPLPYLKSYNLNRVEPSTQSFIMNSSNGYTYESKTGYEKGLIKEVGKDYRIHGGIQECFKEGPATITFTIDNCELKVEYSKDKVCFDNIEQLFEFVCNFDCSRHRNMRFSENIAMVKFMENLIYLEGGIRNGTSTIPTTMEMKNGLIYKGNLVEFKMHGKGVVIGDGWEASGEFIKNELRYGNIDYKSGAKYEGQILDYRRNELGQLTFPDGYIYKGYFLNDKINRTRTGDFYQPGKYESPFIGVDLDEFDLCVFVPRNETDAFFVWNYVNDRIYDANFIDQLESSGLKIRESLRNIQNNS